MVKRANPAHPDQMVNLLLEMTVQKATVVNPALMAKKVTLATKERSVSTASAANQVTEAQLVKTVPQVQKAILVMLVDAASKVQKVSEVQLVQPAFQVSLAFQALTAKSAILVNKENLPSALTVLLVFQVTTVPEAHQVLAATLV